jgi:hypothetical protein
LTFATAKFAILEDRERGQVAGDAEHQPSSAHARVLRARDGAADRVIEYDGPQHEDQVRRLTPCIEHETGDEQHAVAPIARHDEVRRERRRQKQEQENRRRKDHGAAGGKLGKTSSGKWGQGRKRP